MTGIWPTQADIEAAERAAAAPGTEWLSMEDAPTDGTPIIGRVDGEPLGMQWAEERRCMLAGTGPGNGLFGEGWEDTYNRLVIFDDAVIDGWLPIPEPATA